MKIETIIYVLSDHSYMMSGCFSLVTVVFVIGILPATFFFLLLVCTFQVVCSGEFPQHLSLQDSNGKKQTVSGFSLFGKEFSMHVCLLCLTLALLYFFSGSLLSKTTRSTDKSRVSQVRYLVPCYESLAF